MSAALMRDGSVIAPAELASTRAERRRGLLGRAGIDGVLVVRPCRQVHTVGMRFPIDVAWCARDGRVVRTATLHSWRVSRPVLRSAFMLEAEAGAFGRWGLRAGDRVEVAS
jgi:uncharacterized protein